MNTNPSQSLGLGAANAVLPVRQEARGAAPEFARNRAAARAEAMQKTGRRTIVAGFVITIVGVVSYCATCFAGGLDADLGDILLRNAVPFGRATLGVLGLGTLVWLVGSFTYLRGAMDAEEEATDASVATEQSKP